MIIDCISDLHGHMPVLEGGDVLIIAGDIASDNSSISWGRFFYWLKKQKYDYKILIAGNHDSFLLANCIYSFNEPYNSKDDFIYLCDDGIEIEGLKFWGSPWTKAFFKMNSKCKAFTVENDLDLAKKWELIPEDVDVLITHSPPFGILDSVSNYRTGKVDKLGSLSLKNMTDKMKNRIHVFGHVHEHGGKILDLGECKYVNASLMDEDYNSIDRIVRIEL